MDIKKKIGEFAYVDSDGNQTNMNFQSFFCNVIKDIGKSVTNPLSILFPFLIDYNLCKPFTTIEKNCKLLRNVLKDFLDTSSDEASVYKQLVNKHGIEEEQALHDIVSLLFAGHDTTSHGISSVIYFLKVYPDCMKKLIFELEKLDINQHTDYSSDETKEKIQN